MTTSKIQTVTNCLELEKLIPSIKSYSSLFIITDKNVFNNYEGFLQRFKAAKNMVLVPGEHIKTLDSASLCWTEMIKGGIDRESLLIAIGGGVITDLGGFVAGCYMRGIDALYIPTTLMGMIDAALGGKNAINHPLCKNLIGLFSQPKEIWICLEFLKSLPNREFISAIAEIIKYGIVYDPALFHYLKIKIDDIKKKNDKIIMYLIDQCCRIKKEIIEKDFKDQNLRKILNFGHTFAHALENITGYNQFLHGEAVAIGMNCAASVSYELGLIHQEVKDQIEILCQTAGLPTRLPPALNIDHLIEIMKKDKKNVAKKLSLIVTKGLGSVVYLDNVNERIVKKALQKREAVMERAL